MFFSGYDIIETIMNEINNNELNYEEDLKLETSSEEVLCEGCSVVVANNEALLRHRKDCHDQHICSECGHMVSGRKRFYDHVRSHNQASCPSCNKTIQKKKLPNHITICSRPKIKGRKKHYCHCCGHASQTEKRLDIHIKSIFFSVTYLTTCSYLVKHNGPQMMRWLRVCTSCLREET